MSPRRTSALVAAVPLAVLAGCGGDPGDGVEAGPTAATAPDTAAPETTEPEPGPDATTASPAGAAATDVTGVPAGVETVATDLDVPWDVTAARVDGGEALLVTEADSGRVLRVLPTGEVDPVTVDGADTVADLVPDGEGGLLGITALPGGDVALYVTASDGNRVVRYAYDETAGGPGGALTDPRVLVSGIPRAQVHNGGRLAVGPDGFLYVTTGDARDPGLSQDPASLAGKILRVTLDGEPAPGNPFGDSPVWSLGHRNVQGLGWLADGTMVASEFGQDTWDEVNVVEPGANYGWPLVEGPGGEAQGFVDPVVAWDPAEASPSGLAVTGDAVYVTALRGQRLWRVPAGSGGDLGEPEPFLVEELGRLRDVEVDPATGSLLVLTSNTFRGEPRDGDDRLVRVTLAPG